MFYLATAPTTTIKRNGAPPEGEAPIEDRSRGRRLLDRRALEVRLGERNLRAPALVGRGVDRDGRRLALAEAGDVLRDQLRLETGCGQAGDGKDVRGRRRLSVVPLDDALGGRGGLARVREEHLAVRSLRRLRAARARALGDARSTGAARDGERRLGDRLHRLRRARDRQARCERLNTAQRLAFRQLRVHRA